MVPYASGKRRRMEEDRVERRLAAILAADVAGYSRLMGNDEEGTLAALKTHRRDLARTWRNRTGSLLLFCQSMECLIAEFNHIIRERQIPELRTVVLTCLRKSP